MDKITQDALLATGAMEAEDVPKPKGVTINLRVGDKVTWTEDNQKVNAYIVGARKELVIVKIHGKPGRWAIPRKNLIESLTNAIMAAKKEIE